MKFRIFWSLPPSSSDYVIYGWVPNGILLVSLPPPLLLPLAAEAVTLFSKGITSSSQDLKQINLLISSKALHPMFLEHWNRQKILSSIRQCFSCLLDEWIANICKKKFQDAFLKILCFEMHMDRPDKSENTFGI